MKVLLPRLGVAVADRTVDVFEALAASDRFHEHALTSDPARADVILFCQCHMVDWRLRAIREHRIARRHWPKVMIYDERDRPWRSFPGVYVSAPASDYDSTSQRAWSFANIATAEDVATEPDILFSFVGSNTAPCREALFGLRHPEGVIEEVTNFNFWGTDAPDWTRHRERFDEVLSRSRFVLCPRGRGTSSIRLYETLAAGRVPVIISDAWVAPRGPDWERCAIRWPEGEIAALPAFLEDQDRNWASMSAAAREAHRDFFANEATFHRMTNLCAELREAGAEPPSPVILRARSVRAAARDRRARSR